MILRSTIGGVGTVPYAIACGIGVSIHVLVGIVGGLPGSILLGVIVGAASGIYLDGLRAR